MLSTLHSVKIADARATTEGHDFPVFAGIEALLEESSDELDVAPSANDEESIRTALLACVKARLIELYTAFWPANMPRPLSTTVGALRQGLLMAWKDGAANQLMMEAQQLEAFDEESEVMEDPGSVSVTSSQGAPNLKRALPEEDRQAAAGLEKKSRASCATSSDSDIVVGAPRATDVDVRSICICQKFHLFEIL